MADAKSSAKYKCPKCNYKGIEVGMPACPECGKKFNWGNTPAKQTKKKKDTSKDYLMNFYYWFQMLTFICPIAGIIIWKINSDYRNNLNRRKAELYDRYTKRVFISLALWVLLLIALAVIAGMSYKQASQGG